MKRISFLSVILLLSLGLIWSLGFSIARYCTTHQVHPLGYAFWQSLGPAVLLTILCQFLRIRIFNNASCFIFYLFSGLIGLAIPNANMYFAAPQLPSGILAVIINISPIITYLLALSFKEEAFRFLRCMGVLLAVIGLLIMTQINGQIHSNMIPWMLSALITPISFALCAIFVSKYRPNNTHSLGLAAGMLWGSTFWLLPTILFNQHFYFFHASLTKTDMLLLLEILLSSLGYWILFQLLKYAGAVYYSLVGGVVAIASLIWGKLFFSESLSLLQIISIVAILLGIILVSLEKNSFKKVK